MTQHVHADIEYILHILESTENEMILTKEFKELSLQFYQDLEYEEFANREELYKFVLRPFRQNDERERLRAFLDILIQDTVSDDELKKIWWSSSADVVFHDGAELRALLRDLRDRL